MAAACLRQATLDADTQSVFVGVQHAGLRSEGYIGMASPAWLQAFIQVAPKAFEMCKSCPQRRLLHALHLTSCKHTNTDRQIITMAGQLVVNV